MIQKKTLLEIEEKYNLELDKILNEIKRNKFKVVLLQFPDGLKPYSTTIVDYLEEHTKAKFLIWLGSCFGACDTPNGLDKLNPKIDLIVQFGHNNLMPSYC